MDGSLCGYRILDKVKQTFTVLRHFQDKRTKLLPERSTTIVLPGVQLYKYKYLIFIFCNFIKNKLVKKILKNKTTFKKWQKDNNFHV